MGTRRDFFRKSGLLSVSFLVSKLTLADEKDSLRSLLNLASTPFTLPSLPYAYDALEPYIDKQTMELHHSKHHQAYINKINENLPAEFNASASQTEICAQINKDSAPVWRNNFGGHFNHSLFWQLLRPNKEGKSNVPSGKISEAINRDFKSFEEFRKEFSDKALKIFGSGWCWLVEQNGKLKIITTPNQDNPLMEVGVEKGKIILCLDVWEHAYYLKYQNKRVDYISGWWFIINWEKAEELFLSK